MKKKRKRKFGIWLINTTNREDDEWVFVWAYTRAQAINTVSYQKYRFTIGECMPIKKFRYYYRV